MDMPTTRADSPLSAWGLFWFNTAAVTAYSLPWLISPGVSLQPGAFDLAEWLTLLPAVRANMPLLLPALLLRVALLSLGWFAALSIKHSTGTRAIWGHIALTAGVFLALVPPAGFFRGQFNDINYQQQFALWLVYSLSSGWVILRPARWAMHGFVLVIVAMAGAVCGAVGLVWGFNLMARYEYAFTLGVGGAAYTALMGGMALWQLTGGFKSR